MTKKEIELKKSLSEVLENIEIAFTHSAWLQYFDYRAKSGEDNWLSRARKLIEPEKPASNLHPIFEEILNSFCNLKK